MKKLMITLLLGMAFVSTAFAADSSYGEDLKGECTKGKGSSRGQETIVTGSSSEVAAKSQTTKDK